MKKLLLAGGLLTLVLLVSLLVSIPARLLSLVIPGEQLLMQGLTGTLWQGRSSRCLLRLPAGYLQLGAVQWSLEPLSLLMLAPRLTVSSVWGEQSVSGELVLRGAQDLDIIDLRARVSAELLRHFAPVRALGNVSVALEELQLRDGLPYAGEGRVEWQNGAWRSARGLIPLGSYTLNFQQIAGEPLRAQVGTLSGPLLAEGGLELNARQYSLDVLVGSESSLDPQLEQALSLIAVKESAGHRISLEGDF